MNTSPELFPSHMHEIGNLVVKLLYPLSPEYSKELAATLKLLTTLELAGTIDLLGPSLVASPNSLAHLANFRLHSTKFPFASRYGIPYATVNEVQAGNQIEQAFVEEARTVLIKLANPAERAVIIQSAADALEAHNHDSKPVTHVMLTPKAELYAKHIGGECKVTSALLIDRTNHPALPFLMDGIASCSKVSAYEGSIWQTCRILDKMRHLSQEKDDTSFFSFQRHLLNSKISTLPPDKLEEAKEGLNVLRHRLGENIFFPIDEALDVRTFGDLSRFLRYGQTYSQLMCSKEKVPRIRPLPLLSQFMQATALTSTLEKLAIADASAKSPSFKYQRFAPT